MAAQRHKGYDVCLQALSKKSFLQQKAQKGTAHHFFNCNSLYFTGHCQKLVDQY